MRPLFKNWEPGAETPTFKGCSQRGDLEKGQWQQGARYVSCPRLPSGGGRGEGLCSGRLGPGCRAPFFLFLPPHLNEPPAKAPLNVCLCLNCLFTSDKRLSDLGESKFRWGAAVSTKRSGKGGLAGPGPSEAAPNALFWE